jgi:hypothetical protein
MINKIGSNCFFNDFHKYLKKNVSTTNLSNMVKDTVDFVTQILLNIVKSVDNYLRLFILEVSFVKDEFTWIKDLIILIKISKMFFKFTHCYILNR